MGNRSFPTCNRSDFSFAARISRMGGYRPLDGIEDMDSREMDLSFSCKERLAQQPNPPGRPPAYPPDFRLVRAARTPARPAARYRRDRHRQTDAGLVGFAFRHRGYSPDGQFLFGRTRTRTHSPAALSPYVTTDSLAPHPWMPLGEPHLKALGRWEASQVTSHRNTGGQGLSLGQYALYWVGFILAGDLAGARSGYGGLTAQINNLANVLNPGAFGAGSFFRTSPTPPRFKDDGRRGFPSQKMPELRSLTITGFINTSG